MAEQKLTLKRAKDAYLSQGEGYIASPKRESEFNWAGKYDPLQGGATKILNNNLLWVHG